MPKQPTRTILVTGDVVIDHNIYCGEDATTWAESHLGGAFLPYSILERLQTLQEDGVIDGVPIEVACGLDTTKAKKSSSIEVGYSLWRSCTAGESSVWRLAEPLGMGHASPDKLDSSPYSHVPGDPDVLVVDEGNRGFRSNRAREAWPAVILDEEPERVKWVVLKMSSPIGQGDLWRALEPFRDKLVVLLSIDEIRREEVMVTKGISWERTALELIRELSVNPLLRPLQACPYVIISFRSAGALFVDRTGKKGLVYTLLYDPAHLEGEWGLKVTGGVFGHMSCLTASVAFALTQFTGEEEGVGRGMLAKVGDGLSATRKLLHWGHGRIEAGRPGIPFEEIAAEIASPTESFSKVDIPAACEGGDHANLQWTIVNADAKTDQQKRIPLYGLAQRIAWNGRRGLGDAPHGVFGHYVTIDRDEMEGLRNLKRLVLDYERANSGSKPLSIGVFGQPGSGKSFIVKQIAKAVLGSDVPFLEFNLSQFDGPDDLIGAFHQVRDKVLEGRTPVVFWDEFDSREYFWLQYLLAPMQDGKFQEGQITHPIGKSVFIFAGGTSFDLANFGPDEEKDPGGFDRFKKVKGPDFVSRLSGNLDVLGPNQRQAYNRKTEAWENDEADVSFPVRRALLLRALLGLGPDETLYMDSGICAALLETHRYTHGARSMENVLQQMRYRSDSSRIKRSDLPPAKAISMHIDYDEFLDLVRRNESFKERVDETMAEAVHEFYRKLSKEEGWTLTYDMPYAGLPEDVKEDNRAAAARIPEVLALAGLFVVPKRTPADKTAKDIHAVIEQHLEVTAEAEHDRWKAHKESNGWVQVDRKADPSAERDDVRRIHDLLVAYSDLPEKEKGKDRNSVRRYPDVLDMAGYKIVDRLK